MKMIEKAQKAWGNAPDWVMTLAEEADRFGSKRAGIHIGYSRTMVSLVVHNKYKGPLDKMKANVESFLMQRACSLIGEIITIEACEERKRKDFNFRICKKCKEFKDAN